MNAEHYNPTILAEARKKKFTRKELAETLDVAEMTIYRAEKGLGASFELLSDMCREIGVDVKNILVSTPDKNFYSAI